MMPAFSPSAHVLHLLLCALLADLPLAYISHGNFIYYSWSQNAQPCSTSSMSDCRCKNFPLSTAHWPLSHSTPVFQRKHLTVWFSSPSTVMRLLNNSEVRHLTLIHCGPTGEPRGATSFPQEGYFAVQRLERLTVVNMPERPFHLCTDTNCAKSTNANQDTVNSFPFDSNKPNRDKDTNMDLVAETMRSSLRAFSPQIQDIFLGRELGAAHHEQARLGVIHSSVLDWGAEIKTYTVLTHIDSGGTLPFPDLHLAKLPEASVIYVSFVY
ncbi:uncharacterized protein si:ch73-52p7.1 [Girardinichthys multiradiatus]|uniref:uncharacterized protein si:ch73-52p7.1 n=1 Tax=Girardinichthys multiradiatus TaxID=208333 RepID=UPI001FAE43C8|nr:uncharacterized protein si:ch73-52p7.1 [Girardinichthys multiradiatus]XP_047208515.1 uncharacterized protein si:ch73-52p7.1 [Girardinichthys multiradiatus]